MRITTRKIVVFSMLSLLFIGTSCDPISHLTYEVTNKSDEKIILLNSNICPSTDTSSVKEIKNNQTISLGSEISIGALSGRRLFDNNIKIDSLKFCFKNNLIDTILVSREEWKFKGILQNKRAVLVLE